MCSEKTKHLWYIRIETDHAEHRAEAVALWGADGSRGTRPLRGADQGRRRREEGAVPSHRGAAQRLTSAGLVSRRCCSEFFDA